MDVNKASIRPTPHYLNFHSDVDWDLVVLSILSPTKTLPDKRFGKNRFTYIRKCGKGYIIKVHVEKDSDNTFWVINAFKAKNG